MIPQQCYVLILKCVFYLNILDAQDINPSSPVVIYSSTDSVSAAQKCSSFSAVGDMVLYRRDPFLDTDDCWYQPGNYNCW